MGNARDKTGMIEFVSRTMSETILMFFQKVSVFCEISHQISNFPGNVPIKIKLFFHGFFPMGQKNHPLFAARSCFRTPLRAALVLDEQGHMGGLATAAEAGRPAG